MHGLAAAAVHQRRDFAVGVDRHEAAGELVALADADRPRVIFGVNMPLLEQLLEHDSDLLPIRCGERVELERMLADRQLLVVRGSGDWPVDVRELATAALFPLPHLWGHVLSHLGSLSYKDRSWEPVVALSSVRTVP
jgi:hypothetical protein